MDQMFKFKVLPAILAALPASLLVAGQAGARETATEACKAHPGATAPRGSHWYYRINRPDGRHCWFLGSLEQHHHSATPRALLRRPAAASRNRSATAAAADAPSPRITLLKTSITADPYAAPASPASPEPPRAESQASMDFATRWPDDLPDAQDVSRPLPATMSNSYAEPQQQLVVASQIEAPWTATDTAPARQKSGGGYGFATGSLFGGLTIVLLLLMARTAQYGKRLYRTHLRRPLRLLVRGLQRRPRAGFVAPVVAGFGPRPRHLADPPPTPTDPAQDLKTSLAELMRDLRRAGATPDPVRPPSRFGRIVAQGSIRQKLRMAPKDELARPELRSARAKPSAPAARSLSRV
jgi:hypothetical protein